MKSKKLKVWNGRGWGRSRYNKKGEKIRTPLEEWCEHIHVCAHSKAEAVRIVNEVSRALITVNEINVYWSNCWGNSMDGIEPEVGVWGQQHLTDKPIRLWPKTNEKKKKKT